MRLLQWKANGWLQAHQTSPAQIADLLAIVDRHTAGTVSQSEAIELRQFTQKLRNDVTAWLKANHPTLISDH